MHIYYPSFRTQFAAKLASIKEINFYSVAEKKNLHLVKKAKSYTEKWLKINKWKTETKIYVSHKSNVLDAKKLKNNYTKLLSIFH